MFYIKGFPGMISGNFVNNEMLKALGTGRNLSMSVRREVRGISLVLFGM